MAFKCIGEIVSLIRLHTYKSFLNKNIFCFSNTLSSSNVCIVTLIGKGSLTDHLSKSVVINDISGREVFSFPKSKLKAPQVCDIFNIVSNFCCKNVYL